MTKVIAHRGGKPRGQASASSDVLDIYNAAMSADGILLPVRATADSGLVFLHDASVSVGDSRQAVDRLNFATLYEALEMKVPTVGAISAILRYVSFQSCSLFLEPKDVRAAELLLAVIRSMNVNDRPVSVVSSRVDVLKALSRQRRNFPAWLSAGVIVDVAAVRRGTSSPKQKKMRDALDVVTVLNALPLDDPDAVFLNHEIITSQEVVQSAQAANGGMVPVVALVVDDPDEAKRLRDWGINGVVTNFPKKIRSALKRTS